MVWKGKIIWIGLIVLVQCSPAAGQIGTSTLKVAACDQIPYVYEDGSGNLSGYDIGEKRNFEYLYTRKEIFDFSPFRHLEPSVFCPSTTSSESHE